MDIATRPDLLPLLLPPKIPTLLQTLDTGKGIENKEQARAAAEKFEAFFLRTVLEDLIPAPKDDAFGGGGNAEKIWTSQLHEQYAELLAKRGGVGIADLVYQQLLTLQEVAQENSQEATQEISLEATQATQSQQPFTLNPKSSPFKPSILEEQAR